MSSSKQNTVHDPSFEALLDYLNQMRAFDFSGYKRSSLMRRIDKRMTQVGVASYEEYRDYLEVHPEEFPFLLNTILINVTAFFRDPTAWEYLAKEVFPRLEAGKKKDEPLRCWCAGCSSGEEPYTLAILLAEFLGMEEFCRRVKIYATDIDEEALAKARQAVYSPKDVEAISPALLKKYFEPIGGNYVFRGDLRRCVIFGRHDLIQDAPISRLDLILCRNTLMYFNTETQTKILPRLYYALKPSGFLFLGKAEMLLTHSDLFSPENLKDRIFTKVPRPNGRERLGTAAPAGEKETPADRQFAQIQINEAFEALPFPQLTVSANGLLVLTNHQARTFFGLTPKDLGQPFRDLELSYRPADLRSIIDRVVLSKVPQKLSEVEFKHPESQKIFYLEIHAVPLRSNGGEVCGVTFSFIDMTSHHQLQMEVQHIRQDLETANEELQSANEELETTNEELQSTVEELQTTNEELQSTNEEMETMNEELQATNEELQTTNEELRQRTDEAKHANIFMQSILTGLRSGVIVMDRNLMIRSWNHKSQDLWGIRSEEAVGQCLMNLEIGLPVDKLRPLIRSLLAGEATIQECELPATNRRGKTIRCQVTGTPLIGDKNQVIGVILLIEEKNIPDNPA